MFEEIEAPPRVPVRNCFQRISSSLMRKIPWIDGVAPLRKGLKGLSYPLDLAKLDRELSSRSPGILHVQWALLPLVDAFFWRRWKRKGWRIVYTAHDVNGLDGTTPGLLAGANRRLFTIADAVVVHSERDRAEVVRLGADASRVRQVPQGTPGIFQGSHVSREDARRELALSAERPIILFFGLLKAYKSLEVLLSAIAIVRDEIPDVLLSIVGKPLTSSRSYERVIDDLDLTNAVRWERSYVPSSRVGLHFAAANAVALPYRAASSSAVLLNAFAHGRAVVATKVGAFPEMVHDGVTGLLVTPDSPKELAAALVALLRDRKAADEMGERARAYANTDHEWPIIGRVTGEVYRSIEAPRA
jgi:glycosyltransferase involved in cell wall biosynthesis